MHKEIWQKCECCGHQGLSVVFDICPSCGSEPEEVEKEGCAA